MLDFSKLISDISKTDTIHPRDIFMTLPNKNKAFEYPRDVQSEVWKKWFEKRNEKNSIIRMNTGSGKTVVGLMILESCLREGKGPAVYVVPDNYLVEQVKNEANNLGLQVVVSETDYGFRTNTSILVINITKLVNGKSVFGMRNNNNVNIGSVLIDDVHACLNSIENKYTISIPSNTDLYNSFLSLFKDSLIQQCESKFIGLQSEDPTIDMLVPFWDWQNKHKEIYSLLYSNIDKYDLEFTFPLIKDYLKLCNCVISSGSIEISPKCIPISKIRSFELAERRIFMSATLADDSVFAYTLNILPENISTIITPDEGNDIGDKIIIFPQVINKKITDEEIKYKLAEYSRTNNVVVIVPSNYRAQFWSDVSDQTLSAANIADGVQKLKAGHVGLSVFINKYDGIDLPDDACRILVIDGLPKLYNSFDKIEINALPKSTRILKQQIQKIEQGMGRGVRSHSDYCAVILMGNHMADILYRENKKTFFSEATRKQFLLSEKASEQLRDKNIDEIFTVVDYFLKRDNEWVKISLQVLSSIQYSDKIFFDNVAVAVRKAFNAAEIMRFEEAASILNELSDKTDEPMQRGWIKQMIAEYTNFFNPVKAQELLLSALGDNISLIKPISGIQYNKTINKITSQSQNFVDNISSKMNGNDFILKVNSITEKLVFAPNSANAFEDAFKEIAFCIGLDARRPEQETGKGPDVLWDIGNMKFFVLNAKMRQQLKQLRNKTVTSYWGRSPGSTLCI